MVERKPKGDAAGQGAGGSIAETLKTTGSAVRGATRAVSGATGMDAVSGVGQQVQGAAGRAGGAVERAAGGGEQRTVGEELREIVREAALAVLAPVARSATTQAAQFAVKRGPQLARDTIAPKLADIVGGALEEAGGPVELAKGALSSVSGARAGILEKVRMGRESRSRPWRERRLPVEESIDVVAPLEAAYDRFTEFEEYATFLARGDAVDERTDERIIWERTGGAGATAVITFHRLSDRLTRVMVTYDDQPQGVIEKTTALFRASRRGLNADLMRFKAFVEMSEEDSEGPEGEPEEEAEEPRGIRGTHGRRDGGEYAEEDESGEQEEGEDEYEEDEPGAEYEEEPPPVHSQRVRRRPAARPRQQGARRR
jgi:uncharacterized membrane protein